VMDLAPPRSPERYRRLDPTLLPPLFVAWATDRTKDSGTLHRPLRERWERKDPEVMDVLAELRSLVDAGVEALEGGEPHRMGPLMTRNFELRRKIFHVSPEDVDMVDLAAAHGCPAKLAGSGGAIVGIVMERDEADSLARAFIERGQGFLRLRPEAQG